MQIGLSRTTQATDVYSDIVSKVSQIPSQVPLTDVSQWSSEITVPFETGDPFKEPRKKVPPPEVPPFGFDLNWPGIPQGGGRKRKGRASNQYSPSLAAYWFDIRGKRPSQGEYSSGLTIRPINSRRAKW
jgi:hypothetical protein